MNIRYTRNSIGQFVAGHRTAKNVVIVLIAILLMGGIAYAAQVVAPILPAEASADERNGCVRKDGGLVCDFTSPDLRDQADELMLTPSEHDKSVEGRIRRIAWEEGFADVEYLVNLAKCESRLDMYAVNGNNPGSGVDRGLYQINDRWQKGVANDKAFDLDWSTRWTINKLKAGGHGLWMCDKIVRKKMGRS